MIRVGVLGAAGIAPAALLRPARRRDDVVVAAVASRRPAAAAAYAAEHGIPVAHGSYDDLIADDALDVVYNALPPSEHARWSVAALEAGRHVLCEKPIALDADEARTMVAAARRTGRRLVEAFHHRHHPLTLEVLELVRSGALGALHRVEASFTASIPFDPASIRHDPAVGGGALMDLGCYTVHWVRALTGEEPEVVAAEGRRNPLGADDAMTATLRFPSGVTGRVHADMGVTTSAATVRVEGERGVLEVDGAVLPHRGHSVRSTVDGVQRTWTVGGAETYDHQLAALVHALEHDVPLPTEGADVVANMTAIDGIYRGAGWR